MRPLILTKLIRHHQTDPQSTNPSNRKNIPKLKEYFQEASKSSYNRYYISEWGCYKYLLGFTHCLFHLLVWTANSWSGLVHQIV